MNEEQKELNEEKLLRLKTLSHKLDEAITIPGTERKIGIDPIIGLIPGVGDLVGGMLTLYIMHAAIAMGASRKDLCHIRISKFFKRSVKSKTGKMSQ